MVNVANRARRCSAASSGRISPWPWYDPCSRVASLPRGCAGYGSTMLLPRLPGAGEGNRTLVISLEGCCSTIELHPRVGEHSSELNGWVRLAGFPTLISADFAIPYWWRGLDSNQRRRSQRIYSPSPLATRAPLEHAWQEPKRKRPAVAGRGNVNTLWGLRCGLSTPNPCCHEPQASP